MNGVRITLAKRVRGIPKDFVPIRSIHSHESRIEIFRNRFGLNSTNIALHALVQGVHPSISRNSAIKVANLTSCMSAAIGSASSNNLAILARDSANSISQCSLNSSLSSLCGPAAEIGSVVSDGEFYPSQPALRHKFELRHRGGCRS